jgi:hypothetical protein
MTKMASWLNCKRFQTKMNSRSQKFLERGSLLYVLLGLHSPTLRGKNEAFVLDKKGSPPAPPYGVQMAKGLHQPLRFRPARPHGVKCAYWWKRVSTSPALRKVQMALSCPWQKGVSTSPTLRGANGEGTSSSLEVSSSPALRGEMCILMEKRVSTSPTPRDTNGRGSSPVFRFRPAWPHGVKCAYWCCSFVLSRLTLWSPLGIQKLCTYFYRKWGVW